MTYLGASNKRVWKFSSLDFTGVDLTASHYGHIFVGTTVFLL
jgi:hypothetical protein